MNPTGEPAQRLRQELQVWMERNGLAKGTVWRTAVECDGDDGEFPSCYYECVLIYEDSELYDVLEGHPTAEPAHSRSLKLFDEFEDTVRRHGYRFERLNNWSAAIFKDDLAESE